MFQSIDTEKTELGKDIQKREGEDTGSGGRSNVKKKVVTDINPSENRGGGKRKKGDVNKRKNNQKSFKSD